MRRIFWDAMLFIYLLEDHPIYFARCEYLLTKSYERGDLLFTSHLALGEILAGAEKSPLSHKTRTIQQGTAEMGFRALPFDAGAVEPFAELRGRQKIRIADAIHLACAASAGIDLFLTGDKQLPGLHLPGVHFIADFQTSMI